MADDDIARVKRNIQKMIDAGAPPAKIDQYIAGEGVTKPMLQSPGLYEGQGRGGLQDYLPAPVTQALQNFTDMTTSSGATATRNFGTDETDTQAARDRIKAEGGSTTLPDIITSIASSPYRIASTGMGALAGGLEGAASEYGKQENWIPGKKELADIGTKAAVGSGLGFVGAKAGDILGDLYSRARAKGEQLFKSNVDLEDAAIVARNAGASNADDLATRANVTNMIDLVKKGGGDKETFRTFVEGMDMPKATRTAAEAALAKADNPMTDTWSKSIGDLGAVAGGGAAGMYNPWLAALGGYAGKKAGQGAGSVVDRFVGSTGPQNTISDAVLENIASVARDPAGRGLNASPVQVDDARTLLSQLFAAGGRTEQADRLKKAIGGKIAF